MPACHAGGHGFESRTHRKPSDSFGRFFYSPSFFSPPSHRAHKGGAGGSVWIGKLVRQDLQSWRIKNEDFILSKSRSGHLRIFICLHFLVPMWCKNTIHVGNRLRKNNKKSVSKTIVFTKNMLTLQPKTKENCVLTPRERDNIRVRHSGKFLHIRLLYRVNHTKKKT